MAMAKKRSGGDASPTLTATLEQHRDEVLVALELPSPWSAALDGAPRPHVELVATWHGAQLPENPESPPVGKRPGSRR